jgi:phospholipid/cholesterol/gamma-HCH transport system permease protein
MILKIIHLFGQTLLRAFQWPWRWKEIAHNTVNIGLGSLPIITLSTAFAGIVVTTEIAWHMDEALHTITMIPGFTGQFILREIGIVIPALLLVAKVGASTTAEIGTMKVTEQIDALRLLRIDPISYLVFPRFIASILSIACLTLIAIAVTLFCAITVAMLKYNFSPLEYINALRPFIAIKDIFGALLKGIVFGALIPVVSCAHGFECKGGAEGVGNATTDSVVISTILVIVFDFILTFLLTLF